MMSEVLVCSNQYTDLEVSYESIPDHLNFILAALP
jgi:hypothetical protein